MIVKFHARGVGRGSGPVDYLLGPQRDREGATRDRGDPGLIEALIDSSPYAKKYTSGVLSFQEADLPREDKDKLMDSFERALLPGLDRDQYACLWVEHRDKERLELNFVIPNIELLSGKRLQPYFDRADRPRIDAWKVVVNAQLGLHDPDDPLNKRALMTPSNLPKAKQDAAQAITDGLLSLAAAGELADRLNAAQLAQRPIQIRQIERLGKRQRLHGLSDIVELLNAAYAAAGAPGQRATALFQPHKAAAGEFDLHFKAVASLHHVHAVDLLRMVNDAFREGKTDGEQFEIFRRSHHHHVRDAVVNERNGHLFRQKIRRGMGNVGRSVYRQFHNARRQG